MIVMCDDGSEYADMVTPHTIIDHVDMRDCTNEQIEVYKVEYGVRPQELYIYGCWHNMKDPLYIKVIDENGNVEFDGYGTDH